MRAAHPLWDIYKAALAGATYTDLTHSFHPGQPKVAAFPDEERAFVYAHGEHPFQVDRFSIVGQWGTHVDSPLHFVKGGRAVDELPVHEMLRPLCVLDISARVADDPDSVPTVEDLIAWEGRNGRVPIGAFVALRTDWHTRWPDPERFANRDDAGNSHVPGWSRPVLEVLIDDRRVVAIGHEQIDTDPGSATTKGDFSLEDYVLRQDRWQIELLAHLDRVPEAGALIAVMWPRPRGGTGFPARAMAIHI